MKFFHLALAAIEMSSLNFRAGGGAVAEQVYINYPKPVSFVLLMSARNCPITHYIYYLFRILAKIQS